MTIDTKKLRELHAKATRLCLEHMGEYKTPSTWLVASAETWPRGGRSEAVLLASAALFDSAEELISAAEALNRSLADAEMAEHAHDACEEQLATAERERDAALARAERAEKALGAIVDVAEDVDKYVDDRDASKALREAVEAGRAALKGGE